MWVFLLQFQYRWMKINSGWAVLQYFLPQNSRLDIFNPATLWTIPVFKIKWTNRISPEDARNDACACRVEASLSSVWTWGHFPPSATDLKQDDYIYCCSCGLQPIAARIWYRRLMRCGIIISTQDKERRHATCEGRAVSFRIVGVDDTCEISSL